MIAIPTVKCSGCGTYIIPEIKNGRFYCPFCGEDVTEEVRKIDPELVERISHSSVHSVSEFKK